MMSDLKTMVHVESLKRFCRVLKISATPASPAWVAMRMCSTYLALGGAGYFHVVSKVSSSCKEVLLALIFVPPLTDFSKDPDIPGWRWRDIKREFEIVCYSLSNAGEQEYQGMASYPSRYRESPSNRVILV